MAENFGVLQQKSASTVSGVFANYAYWVLDGQRVDKVIIDNYLDSLVELDQRVGVCRSKEGLVVAIETRDGERVMTKILPNTYASLISMPIILVYFMIGLPFFIVAGIFGILVVAGLFYLYPGRQYFRAKRTMLEFMSKAT